MSDAQPNDVGETDTETDTGTDAQADITTYTDVVPENACHRYEICGNVVPARGKTCAECLDELRAADRERRRENDRRIDT